MNFKSENLILIIGNGFDLAHNYKTSYNDFANHIIDKKLSAEIMEFGSSVKESKFIFKSFLNEINRNHLFNENGNFIQRLTAHKILKTPEKLPDTLNLFSSQLKQILNNRFLGKLFGNQFENWFDIENAYFFELISIFKTTNSKAQKTKEIVELNNNLIEIKETLFEYLKTIKTEPNRYVKKFFNSINIDSFQNVYVINFNYTISIENYIEQSDKIKINYIHGDIDSKDIIFGYGNDQHPNYKDIKATEIDEFLRFFKTFEYLNNNKYNSVYEDALEYFDEYDVVIIGHSLAQTDKTLLKEILNNQKCNRIHLFKRSDLKNDLSNIREAFNKQIYSISRIIDNEKDLRVKLKNYEESTFFP
ncbi:AbiH family protein [Pontimicrobium aquaticum]|uniref:Bacteriophage abortive infection AbiH n=1 Tax=Pontimicrobium aquaticum TaxID=2565367 RepID=A0A4U0F032_9FLAO|nr:AbiH family protein [Pontimicrobium aquaticum]TJY36002.1 hypothetical protein E5167_09070 [Pontimicrobium aquaticum]